MTGDSRLIERLVANLVDNALRYNIDHGEVAVMTEGQEGCARLSVVNTGPIVPSEDVDGLVQPFRRPGSDRTRHGEGFGLGLSIVQAIVEAHGAALTISPQAGGGLAVVVTLAGSNTRASDGAAERHRESTVSLSTEDVGVLGDERDQRVPGAVLSDGRDGSTPSRRR